jgi:hypothetical protein
MKDKLEENKTQVVDFITTRLADNKVTTGFVAGGAICSIINEFFNKKPAIINDIDIFINRCAGVSELKIESSEKDGLINYIKVSQATQVNEHQTYLNILKSFDLNCSQVGFDVDSNLLIYTPDFINWLNSNLIEIVKVTEHFPLGSILRSCRKAEELGSAYYPHDDIRYYFWLNKNYYFFESNAIECNLIFSDQEYKNDLFGVFLKRKEEKHIEKYKKQLEPYIKFSSNLAKITFDSSTINCFIFLSQLKEIGQVYHFDYLASFVFYKFPAQDLPKKFYKGIISIYKDGINLNLNHLNTQVFHYFNQEYPRYKTKKVAKFLKKHEELNLLNFKLLNAGWDLKQLIEFYFKLSQKNIICIGIWEACLSHHTELLNITQVSIFSLIKEKNFDLILDYLDKEEQSLVSKEVLKEKEFLPKEILSFACELTTASELIREGIIMHHCVGGYSNLVKNKHSLIFHIQTDDGDSTVELIKMLLIDTNGKMVYGVSQHKAKYNANPAQLNQQKVEELLSFLNQTL